MIDKTKTLARGNDNTQISGDGNINNSSITHNYYASGNQLPLSKSKMYELLGSFMRSQVSESEDYSLKLPAEMNRKLRFNNASIHIEIFETYSEDYACLSEVIADFPGSELIVRKLREIFIRHAPRDNSKNRVIDDGDECLNHIEAEVKEIIISDKDFNATEYLREEVERFSIALVAYGVSKCKILENPDDHASS